ncbi:hypothetical protein ASF06_09190 [Agreia sp. Leaf244]|uniref:hypothetical protein n=1 Tax=Agreia sp. Leaf244 TaxID=1736305 RepID=UPI00072BC41C|nr:hypothetical protein [Agreia sp. Leaf244]KQO10332.1 hypothetical protein ASF06_09190 [Agreia sp. Leaf244]
MEPLAPGMRRIGAILRRLPGASIANTTPEQLAKRSGAKTPELAASILMGKAPKSVTLEDRTAAGVPVRIYPEWTATPGQATLGTQEATLLPLLESREHLDCFWVAPGGGSGMGLSTSISLAASDELASLVSQLTAAGFGCTEQSGGTRCAVDRSDEYALWGETHFIGGGLWIATFYVDFAPDGYTDDIVRTLVPA